MELIAVVDNNWGIGNNGQLLFSLPNDLQRFKSITVGGVVIMGRKTFESLPNQKPLPNRVNIVLTRESYYVAKGANVVNSIEDAISVAYDMKNLASAVSAGAISAAHSENASVTNIVEGNINRSDINIPRVFVIGGEDIYRQMLPYCTVAHITKVDSCKTSDRHMVNLDNDNNWQIAYESIMQIEGDISYKYVEYRRKK